MSSKKVSTTTIKTGNKASSTPVRKPLLRNQSDLGEEYLDFFDSFTEKVWSKKNNLKIKSWGLTVKHLTARMIKSHDK
jgi:hypothetical protein